MQFRHKSIVESPSSPVYEKNKTPLKNLFNDNPQINTFSSGFNQNSGLGLRGSSINPLIHKAQLNNNVENGGLFNRAECHTLAKNIISSYDGNGDGVCETLEVAKWLVDCYRAMNKTFQPTATDIASFVHVIDRNRTGKVSLDDLQNFIARFFFNPTKQ